MTTWILPLSFRALMLIALLLISACGEKTAEKTEAKAPPKFNESHFSEVTPMVDGAAYVSDTDSRLWYVRGNQAIRVRLPDASNQSAESFEITPAVDGSAYLTNALGDVGLLHLIKERAESVVEVGALDYSNRPLKIPDKGFFGLYLAERKKREQLEKLVENPPDPDDPGDDSGPW